MAEPLASEARVRELGALDDANAYLMFRLASDAALTTRINAEIAIASAWLQSRAASDYGTGDSIKDTLFGEAEAYLALQNLYETLKMRKVTGTHFPYLAEDSPRFEQLIDVEMPEHIRKFVEQYLIVDDAHPFQAPVMVLSGSIDRLSSPTKSITQQLDEIIDEATTLPVPFFPLSTDGNRSGL